MIIWKGYGFWIVLLPVIVFLSINSINITEYKHQLTYGILTLGYLVITYFGYKLNSNPIHKYRNNKTGEIFEVIEKHEFFFIRMEYVSIIIIAIILLNYF